MKVNVIGYRKSTFKTNEGNEINGYQIFFSSPIPAEYGAGVKSDKCFVTISKMISAPALGSAEIEFNRYGKVETFTSLEKVK